MTGEPRIVRPSSLTTYADCPRRWAARHIANDLAAAGYELRRGLPSHVGAAVGTGCHGAAGTMLEQKMQDGTLGSEERAVEAGIEAMRAKVEVEGATFDDATPDMNTAEKQVRRMARIYRLDVAPKVEPVLIEERMNAEIAEGWEVSGQMDTVAGDPTAVIRDLKTGTRQRSNGLQYGAYAIVLTAHGYKPEQIIEDFIRRVPLAKEQPRAEAKFIEQGTAMQEAWETLEAIQRDVAEFERRAADPNGRPPHGAFRSNPASPLCGAKWCGAWGTAFCKAHL